jgi:hypothetical protein
MTTIKAIVVMIVDDKEVASCWHLNKTSEGKYEILGGKGELEGCLVESLNNPDYQLPSFEDK